MVEPNFPNETTRYLWWFALTGSLVEDSSDTYQMFLIDIGRPEEWAERERQQIYALTNPLQIAMLERNRFYVVGQRGEKVWFTHANRIDVMAGVFDQMAIRWGMEGAKGGYRAKEDPMVMGRMA